MIMKRTEYEAKYPACGVFFEDVYYESIKELLEHEPDAVSCTVARECFAKLDADDIMTNVLEDSYEDAEFDQEGSAELIKFIEVWNEKYKLRYFEETNLKVILLGGAKE